jgi:cyclohexanone monooxygenase
MVSPTPASPANPDLDSLKEKYRQERERRLREDGELQYFEVRDDYAEFYERDPHSKPVSRDSIDEEIDVAILGGGFAGLLAGAHLKQAGIGQFRILDMGGDFGGTWYWNRYPGVQCDIESYCYLPLLEELNYIPKEKYSHGSEIFEHCRRIGRHFGLYDNALFQTMATSLRWDGSLKRWRIATNHGDDIRARFLIMATGAYNRPKLPGIPGIKSFKGHSFHSSRWDYDYTGGDQTGDLVKLADKQIAIIGTGSSAVQCIPHLGRWARHLYVFQRTPSAVDIRGNAPTDPAWVKALKPGWSKERRDNFNTVMAGLPFDRDLVSDGWTVLGRRMAALATRDLERKQVAALRETEDYRLMDELRARVDRTVERKDVAESLKAWYRWGCKRPTFHDDYLPTYNRANVTLVDVSASRGVDRITEYGIAANGVDYEVDCIIYASGFEVTSEFRRRIGIAVITGRDDLSLYDHWRDGFKTLHGLMTTGFPNQFFTGLIQGGVSPNLTTMLSEQTNHIAYIIKRTMDRGAATVEPAEDAQDEWVQAVRKVSRFNKDFWKNCTPGLYNNEGGAIIRSYSGDDYGGVGRFKEFVAILENWRNEGSLRGLRFGG